MFTSHFFSKIGYTFSLILFLAASPLLQAQDSAYHLMLKGLYKNTVPRLQAGELLLMLSKKEEFYLLDTREKKEFEVSHLKNARWAGYDTFSLSEVSDIPLNAKIVVYCSVGYRSEKIGEKLAKAGYKNVQNLYGGIFEWVNKGFPVYDSTGKPVSVVHGYSPSWGMWVKKGKVEY